MTPLHAKSPRGGRTFPLDAHLRETEASAILLFAAPSRWAEAWARFFRLTEAQRPVFLDTLRVAALAHDLGKANEDFQAMVERRSGEAQTVRHEHLSTLVLVRPEVTAWLRPSTRVDVDVVCGAVLSHHAKATAGEGDFRWGQTHGRGRTTVFLDHPSLVGILGRMGEVAGVGAPPFTLPRGRLTLDAGEWQAVLLQGRERAKAFGRSLPRNPERRRLHLAVKAALMVSDAAASGLVRENLALEQWIGTIVGGEDVSAEEIETKVISPRIAVIEARRGRSFVWEEFQRRAATAPARALLMAGCGTGKTLAAWAWAREQARSHRAGRVVFLYPTRGTATEGFRDYVSAAPEAALLHGTAAFELEQIAANPDDRLHGRSFHTESEARLFALQHWNRRFYSATVDQFLAFLENGFQSMCLLPVLADAIVIVDEVHAFDPHMFSCLIQFLQTFSVPVLCMTATLPTGRIRDLEAAGLQRVSASTLGLTIPSETRPRYTLEHRAPDELAPLIAAAWGEGKRVLWVVNTVRRCQEGARLLRALLPDAEVHVYHSRFTLQDRQDTHTTTIAAFAPPRDGPPPRAIAVTTQVCEMSLDLDADVLITELAPCESLVQRFGRCNRHDKLDQPAFRGRLIVVEPEKALPYEEADLALARTFLAALPVADLDQATLADTLAKTVPCGREPEGDASFLESGWYAAEGSFRDTDERGVRAVLSQDVSTVLAARRQRETIDGWVVPAPWSTSPRKEPGLPSWLWVVDSSLYDPKLGLQDPPKEKCDVATP